MNQKRLMCATAHYLREGVTITSSSSQMPPRALSSPSAQVLVDAICHFNSAFAPMLGREGYVGEQVASASSKKAAGLGRFSYLQT
jgi:hypothetical protein